MTTFPTAVFLYINDTSNHLDQILMAQLDTFQDFSNNAYHLH